MDKIPTNKQVSEWYKEIYKTPSFIESLNTYQKDKIFQYTRKEVERLFNQAIGFFSSFSEENYPEDVSEENRLNYIVDEIMGHSFCYPIFVLNLFDWHWTVNKSFHRITSPKQKKLIDLNPEIGVNDNWRNFVLEGGELSQPEIALLCHYEGIVIPKPSKKNKYEIADNLAMWHGHISGIALYNVYDEISNKTKRLTNRTPETMKKYLKKILPLVSLNNRVSIINDIKEITHS